jgi:hypothetical protein
MQKGPSYLTGKIIRDVKIKKEIDANEGGTVWIDRKARLAGCIASKRRA